MLETIKRAALRGVRAAGPRLQRLGHPPLAVQTPQGPLAGIRAQGGGAKRMAPMEQKSTIDRFSEIERMSIRWTAKRQPARSTHD
jgi:hypothetical protein